MVSGKQQLLDSGSYTVVPNRIFRMGLSVRATALYCWMASKPNNFHFSISGLYKKTEASWLNMGRDSIKKAMKELQDLGLVTKVTFRDPKKGRAVKHDYCINLDPSEILFDVDGNPLKDQGEVTGKPIVREEDNAKKAKMSKLRSRISQPKMTKEMVDDFYPSKENEENDEGGNITTSVSMPTPKRLKNNQTGNPSDCKSDTSKNKERKNKSLLHSSEETSSDESELTCSNPLNSPKRRRRKTEPVSAQDTVVSLTKDAEKKKTKKVLTRNPDQIAKGLLEHLSRQLPIEFGEGVEVTAITQKQIYMVRSVIKLYPEKNLKYYIAFVDFCLGYWEDLRRKVFAWMRNPPAPNVLTVDFFARQFKKFIEAFNTPEITSTVVPRTRVTVDAPHQKDSVPKAVSSNLAENLKAKADKRADKVAASAANLQKLMDEANERAEQRRKRRNQCQ